MLELVKIARRQSEIRQALAGLVGKENPTADETRQIETLDAEFRNNEVRYRGALIAEDTERRAHGDDLETRGEREYAALIGRFELRQAMLFLDEGAPLSGATAEVVSGDASEGRAIVAFRYRLKFSLWKRARARPWRPAYRARRSPRRSSIACSPQVSLQRWGHSW